MEKSRHRTWWLQPQMTATGIRGGWQVVEPDRTPGKSNILEKPLPQDIAARLPRYLISIGRERDTKEPSVSQGGAQRLASWRLLRIHGREMKSSCVQGHRIFDLCRGEFIRPFDSNLALTRAPLPRTFPLFFKKKLGE
jgi:hypothetical protein